MSRSADLAASRRHPCAGCFGPKPGPDKPEVDITVSSVEDAVRRFVNAGGTVLVLPDNSKGTGAEHV